jgi:SAM-dependent methyltransferase
VAQPIGSASFRVSTASILCAAGSYLNIIYSATEQYLSNKIAPWNRKKRRAALPPASARIGSARLAQEAEERRCCRSRLIKIPDRISERPPRGGLAKFEVGDAQKLSFGDATFDVAIMALVLAFLRDPAKAVAEMARVVRPGGWVATYMWDILNGGSPTTPIYTAIESLGSTVPVRPNPAASRLEAMHGFWEMAGLEAIETRVIRIPVRYADFDDFWDSNTVPVGPQGKVIAACRRPRVRNSAYDCANTCLLLPMDKSSTSHSLTP